MYIYMLVSLTVWRFYLGCVKAYRPVGRRRRGGCASLARVIFFLLALRCRGNEDAPVIHMGMIVGMRGDSIRMRLLKGQVSIVVCDDEKEASK